MLVAVGRGFAELVASGRLPHGPAVECVQPVGNATIAGPLVRHSQKAESVDCTTRTSAACRLRRSSTGTRPYRCASVREAEDI